REHHECVPNALRLLAVDRNRAELGDEHHQDQKPEPECRHRQSAQTYYAQEIIEPGVLLDRADHPERNPEQDRERQRQRRELRLADCAPYPPLEGEGRQRAFCELPGWGDSASPPPGSPFRLADLPPPGGGRSGLDVTCPATRPRSGSRCRSC